MAALKEPTPSDFASFNDPDDKDEDKNPGKKDDGDDGDEETIEDVILDARSRI